MPVIGDHSDLNVKAVVYATDLFHVSQHAGLYAHHLAAHFSAKLLVAHAFEPSQAAMAAEMRHDVVCRQRKTEQLLLSKEADDLKEGIVEVDPLLLEGDPRHVIPELADKYEPSIIVLGTHGGGRWERDLISSTAEHILRSTRWPCFTVGPKVQPASLNTLSIRRILFVTHFTPASANALSFALSIAESFGAGIDTLSVVSKDDIQHPDRLNERQRQFYSALDLLVPEEARARCTPQNFVAVGDPQEQIIAHIKDRSIDLLVMGIRKVTHISLEVRMSRTFQLIVEAGCPVLTIRS